MLQGGVSLLGEGLKIVREVSPSFAWVLLASLEFSLVSALRFEPFRERFLRQVERRPRRFGQALECLLGTSCQSHLQPLELLVRIPSVHVRDVAEMNGPFVPRRLAVKWFGEDDWFGCHLVVRRSLILPWSEMRCAIFSSGVDTNRV